MSQLLPYVGLGLLFLAVLGLWVRQSFVTRAGRAELLVPRQHRSGVGRAAPQRDLGERIFGPEDWDFVSRDTPSEIQRMFQRERTILALAWLRRTRMRTSQVMRAHVVAARQSEDLQFATEIRLALSYLLFLILCDFAAGLRATFEQLMAIVDPANRRALEVGFNQGTAQS